MGNRCGRPERLSQLLVNASSACRRTGVSHQVLDATNGDVNPMVLMKRKCMSISAAPVDAQAVVLVVRKANSLVAVGGSAPLLRRG